ncbi:MAG: beta-galactosidase, partial [Anaerolineae bacterium]|nr:beta-galactosidase [Anaerolineae bacterium]
MRKYLLALVALALCLGSAGGGIALAVQRAEALRGWENAAAPGTALPFHVAHAGVNVDLMQYDDEALAVQLRDMAASGVTWVRQTFPWADIEPEHGTFAWERWDVLVSAVRQVEGLELVAVLNAAPVWARVPNATEPLTAPPAAHADFAAFAGEFAARYGADIDVYQVWDEPNLAGGWGGLDPQAADYVALLQGAYTAIHEADNTATVLLAGLAPTLEEGPHNFSDVSFLRAIYANGGGPYFDAAAGKPYGFATGPDDRRVDENVLNFSRLILLREEMVQQGDAEKPLWASHFGWNALPDDWSGEPSAWGTMSRAEQLTYLAVAYERAAQEWPWLGSLIVEHWQPDAPADDPVWGFALLPPGEARADLPATLFGEPSSEQALAPGRYPATTPAAQYTGEWEFGALGADIGQQGDSEVTFTFTGTDVALELRRDNYRAYLYVTIDGESVAALPQDNAGQSYIILTSDDLLPHVDVIPLAIGLTPGPHTVHIRADRGWDQWALAAFRVGVTADTNAYDMGILVMLVAFVLALVGLIATARQFPPLHLPTLVQRMSGLWQVLLAGTASLVLMFGMFFTWTDHTPDLIRRETPGLLLGLLTAGVLYVSPWFAVTIVAAVALWLLIYVRL